MFQGYSDATLDFMWGIRFNNDRTWFQAHKQEYLDCLLQPTTDLGREVYDRMLEKYPKLDADLHVSRIYRDARRLHGRGPYKDHLWFTIRPERDLWTQQPVFWFEVAPEGWSYGVGFWNASPAMMAAMRRDMERDPKPLEKLARRLNRQDVFTLQGPDYAKPKGTAPSPLLAPWYSKKSLSIGCDRPFDDLVCSPELADTLVEGYDFLMPYYRYLAAFCKTGLEDLK